MLRIALPLFLIASASLLANPAVSLSADETVADSPAVDFVRDIQPILAENCLSCHGEDEQEGQLRLDARAIVFHGGVSGPAIVSGDSKQSLLLRRITSSDDDLRMPPSESRQPLSSEEIDVLRRWIKSGGKYDAEPE